MARAPKYAAAPDPYLPIANGSFGAATIDESHQMFSRKWALNRLDDRMEITEGKRVFGISVR